MHTISIILVSALCLVVDGEISSDTCKLGLSSSGQQFMIGIIGTYYSTPVRIRVQLQTASTASFRITAPFVNFDKHYFFTKHLELELDKTLTQMINGTEFKGIEIKSDADITVSVVLTNGNNFEGFLAIPVKALSTRYITASYTPAAGYTPFSEFMVVGVESDTTVNIELPKVYKNKPSYSGVKTIGLQKFESFQFQGPEDVTGTVISSDKPVAVFSGSACSQIPHGKGQCQYLSEQMIPTDIWDLKYIVPAIYPRTDNLVRIFARESNTTITYANSTHHLAVYLNELEHSHILFGQEPAVIVADKPISVIQYGYDDDAVVGDPFMTTVQAITQYQGKYEFETQNEADVNTLAVTVKTSDLSGLLLDGRKTAIQSAKKFVTTAPLQDYTVVYLSLTYHTFHSVSHERNQPFGAVLYGLGPGYAYGYPLYMTFTDTECYASTDNGTNTTSHGNGHQINYHPNGNGIQCFHCDDMTHLKYCDRVTECTAADEVCYIQSYSKSGDVMRFRSGCISDAQCSSSPDQQGCTRCCHGSFCNSFGCGDDGLLSLDDRGPFCFDCRHLGDQDKCQTVQLCPSNQVCKVEKYSWGDNDNHYIMGCGDPQTCSTTTRAVHDTRMVGNLTTRNVPMCSKCCTSDFCNQNCASEPNVVIVG